MAYTYPPDDGSRGPVDMLLRWALWTVAVIPVTMLVGALMVGVYRAVAWAMGWS